MDKWSPRGVAGYGDVGSKQEQDLDLVVCAIGSFARLSLPQLESRSADVGGFRYRRRPE